MAPRGVYNSVMIEYNVKKSTFIEPYPYVFELLVPRYTADCENLADVSAEDVSDNTPNDDFPDDDILDDIPDDDILDDIPDDILYDTSDDIPYDILDDSVDDIAEDIAEDIPDDIPDDMSAESKGEKDPASVFVGIANEADTSYRASKGKVDITLDGRCTVQPFGR
jgi:hypothetical protein